MKRILVALLCFVGLSACASAQVAKEKSFGKAKSDQALIYFYRPNMFTGSLINWSVKELSDQVRTVGVLKNESYFYVYTAPGKHSYFIDEGHALQMDFKAGKAYYLMGHLEEGAFSSTIRFTVIGEEGALSEMQDKDIVMTIPAQ
jgi:hypothetical protein